MKQMMDDLHGAIEHLCQKYQTDKLILLGHSWGSVLGSSYVLRHPEMVSSYIGAGQVINMRENERIGYQEVLKKARAAGNQKHIQALRQMGNYPPDTPEELLKLLPRIRSIQAAYDHGSSSGVWEFLRTLRRSPVFQWRDLITMTQIMKANRPLHLQLFSFDLTEYPPVYQVPVHYILGEADTVAPASLAKEYYETISAPAKSMTVIPGAGHNLMHEKAGEFAEELRRILQR